MISPILPKSLFPCMLNLHSPKANFFILLIRHFQLSTYCRYLSIENTAILTLLPMHIVQLLSISLFPTSNFAACAHSSLFVSF